MDIHLEMEMIGSCKDSIAGSTSLVPRTTTRLGGRVANKWSVVQRRGGTCMVNAGRCRSLLVDESKTSNSMSHKLSHNTIWTLSEVSNQAFV